MELTAIISGGAGFIGSWLCEYLIEKEFKVFCIDNLITGTIDNIKQLSHERFEFIEHDVIKPLRIPRLDKIDYVFHLAHLASPYFYKKFPFETLMVGSVGTINMLELAKERRAAFLLASSSEIYGESKELPISENYFGYVNPFGPRSQYCESKRFSETCAKVYSDVYSINVMIARIFNTYGPHMRFDDGRVMTEFITKALKGESLKIYGDGKQTRSFCYITDMIEGIYKLSLSKFASPINLGNPYEHITINDLSKKIIELTKSNSPIKYFQALEEDPKERQPDISRAINILNWHPKVSIDDGIKKLIECF